METCEYKHHKVKHPNNTYIYIDPHYRTLFMNE